MLLASIPSPSVSEWSLGPLTLRAYALCIVLGVVVAVWISMRRWRARGGDPGTVVDIAVWAVAFGLIGGRLYHVITDWHLYFGSEARNEPIDALKIWNGGLGIWGAIALGGVGVWIACRRRGIALSAMADTVAPGLAIGQAIGRWGNYFNQELFGGPTDLPWGIEIRPGQAGTIPGFDVYHPTFLYESLWNLALAGVLLWVGGRFSLRHGRLFSLYVAGYTLGRFWIEGMRSDPTSEILGLRLNQWTSIVLFVGALAYFWFMRNKTGEEALGVELPGSGGDGEVDGHGAEQVDEPELADAAERQGQSPAAVTSSAAASSTVTSSTAAPSGDVASGDVASGDVASGDAVTKHEEDGEAGAADDTRTRSDADAVAGGESAKGGVKDTAEGR
ncbi:prolipoprotein diacylglyceryl transferase [Sinosporangium album]|uniref:Phosphatidylglycerol--prolipoprotein diacylglyceryl transferase n=1 Tax=Sinosporangium album TaxID=504805 RepID=A0A1G7X873_9ACTN|nr:prolipoprotein diacylglyceryl transferase [Sinosporangium album]SDG80372.1 prolipoprotein diacylglyceryl transferase [Sinosporangium album]